MTLKDDKGKRKSNQEEIDKELLELVGIIKNEKVDDLKEYMRKNKEEEYFKETDKNEEKQIIRGYSYQKI